MALYPKGSFTGKYQPNISGFSQHDLSKTPIIAFEFAQPPTRYHPGNVNTAIAQKIIELRKLTTTDLILVPSSIGNALSHLCTDSNHTVIIDGSSTYFGTKSDKVYDSYDTALEAKKILSQHNQLRAIIVTQSFLAGRAAKQCLKLGIIPILPESLPTEFETTSTPQKWYKSHSAWAMRELLAVPALKLLHRL